MNRLFAHTMRLFALTMNRKAFTSALPFRVGCRFAASCLVLFTSLLPANATIKNEQPLELRARLGYSLGAATPMGIPATIRKLNSFHLPPNFLIGFDAHYAMDNRWGVQAGLRFENKGMNVAITTKGYHMAMVKGGEQLEGVYTGRVEQETKAWMLTVPLMVTYDLSSQWRLHAGPYLSAVTAKDFSGNVSDGYLRKDTPTGQKIEMGHAMDERATYDFTDDMRRLQIGLAAGIDWLMTDRIGLSADLSWGVTGLMRSDFKTVEQTLYPVYGTISITYRLK